jgi:hypothetical protein
MTMALANVTTNYGEVQSIGSKAVETRIGKLDFEHGVPTQETVTNLYDQMDFQRACQLYLWALPIVGFEQLRVVSEATTGALPNRDVGVYQGYRNLLIYFTPNATTPYSIGVLDLKNGPVVVELPTGAIAGAANDFWQRIITDIGLTGPDQGKGGKYVFVGPGQQTPTTDGVFVMRVRTFGVVYFFRALDPNPEKSAALSRGVRIYPWTERANPPATRYLTPDPDKVVKFLNPPRGMEYWERLAAAIQREPVEDRDRFFMAMLMPMGMEKSKPFQPDARQKKILTEGAFVGEAMAKAESFDTRLPGLRYGNTLWIKPLMAMEPHAGLGELQRTRSARRLYILCRDGHRRHAQRYSRNRASLPRQLPRPGGTCLRWCAELPPARAAQSPRETILVGHALRDRHPLIRPEQRATRRPLLSA